MNDAVDKARAWDMLAEKNREIVRLKAALRNIIDAANSFCDESGDEVAGQIRVRALAALAVKS